MNWAIFLGAFTGSLIELVEILAVVLVVGRVAGWRNALVGAGSAAGLVVVAAFVAGRGLTSIPIHLLEIVAGAILLIFGGWWARSVVRYYGGVLQPADDEDERLRELLARESGGSGWSVVALATAFKSSLLESVEIAIVVVGFGAAGGEWFESLGGALVATAGLICFAVLLRGPLERVPVKPTKFVAAMLLIGFGSYWLGEGLGYSWPGEGWSVVWLPLVWGAIMAGAVAILRYARRRSSPTRGGKSAR